MGIVEPTEPQGIPLQEVSGEAALVQFEDFQLDSIDLKWERNAMRGSTEIMIGDKVVKVSVSERVMDDDDQGEVLYTFTFEVEESKAEFAVAVVERFMREDLVSTRIRKQADCILSGRAVYEKGLDQIQYFASARDTEIEHSVVRDQEYDDQDSIQLTPEQWREIFEPILRARGYTPVAEKEDEWVKLYKPESVG